MPWETRPALGVTPENWAIEEKFVPSIVSVFSRYLRLIIIIKFCAYFTA